MLCKTCNKREINTNRSARCCDICLDKRLESAHKYYNNHKEKVIEVNNRTSKSRKHRLKNSGICVLCGKNKAVKASKCAVCRDKGLQRAKVYRQNNKKKIQESQKRSMAKKPDLYKSLKHSVYENHKDDWYRWGRERRDRKLKAEGSYTKQEWNQVLELFNNRCLCCGSTERIEADHIIPLSKGGTDYITNIQPLCKICNTKKGTKIIDYRPFLVLSSFW